MSKIPKMIRAIPVIDEVDKTTHIRFPPIVVNAHFSDAACQREYSLDYCVERDSWSGSVADWISSRRLSDETARAIADAWSLHELVRLVIEDEKTWRPQQMQ